jgi:COP9 signalosome complex subunit 2
LYEKSLRVKNPITHPQVMGIIRECGGKMHLSEGMFNEAYTDFFEAFKNYDESGSPRRIQCLKYLVLSTMLSKSAINPFDSQEAKPYRNDPEVVALTDLISAYQHNDLTNFEAILHKNHRSLTDDQFIGENIQQLLTNIRSQVLIVTIRPYQRVHLSYLAKHLRVSAEEIISLVSRLIIDESIQARIDETRDLLLLSDITPDVKYNSLQHWAQTLDSLVSAAASRVAP